MGRPKKNDSSDVRERVSLYVDPEVKQWYSDIAESYGMALSAYMKFILISHMNNVKNQEAVRALSDASKSQEVQEQTRILSELVALFKDEQQKEQQEQQLIQQKDD